jgi:hypothetical protein
MRGRRTSGILTEKHGEIVNSRHHHQRGAREEDAELCEF